MEIETVNEATFEKVVLHSEAPVVVAFRASWCRPSQDLVPAIENVTKKLEGRVRTVAIDFDREPELCRRLGVTRVPVTMLFVDGKPVDFVGGMTDARNLFEMVAPHATVVRTIGRDDFEPQVLRSTVPTLVHFDAAWCAASRGLVPLIDEVSQRFDGKANVVRLEVGPETEDIAKRYGIVRVPTLALFVEGKIQDQIFGAMVDSTKAENQGLSSAGLTSLENVSQMVERFAAGGAP